MPLLYMKIPCVGIIKKKKTMLLGSKKICTAFNNQNTVRQLLVKTKTKNSTLDTKNCFNSIKCKCDKQLGCARSQDFGQ